MDQNNSQFHSEESFENNNYGTYTNYSNYQTDVPPMKEGKPQNKKRWKSYFALFLALILVAGGAGGTGAYFGHKFAMKEVAKEQKTVSKVTVSDDKAEESTKEMAHSGNKVTIATTTDGMEGTSVNPTDVSSVVDHVMPAIVSINNIYDSVGENFFGQRYLQKDEGNGSGIIIGQNKDEILIVTNNHVSEVGDGGENQKITVTFHDEKTAEATVKGADESADLSVISVKVKDLSPETLKDIRIATLGNSDKMKVGQMVIAIGNALGYGQSTTVGYVSAVNREVIKEDFTMKLLQTDAAINPGNSGGALLNPKGEVIGINTIKYASSKVEGMGFAIPITTAIPIINDLMNREEITESEQSYLGIMGQDVTERDHEVYGIPMGVYVVKVTENSPASQYGLKTGDIITEFNGYKIRTMKELQSKIANVKAGKSVNITIQTNPNGKYEEKQLQVTLGYRSEMKESFQKEEKNQRKRSTPSRKRRRSFDGGQRRRGLFDNDEDVFDFFFNP